MLKTMSKRECSAIAKVNTPEARSPVLTNHPWAQQVQVPVVMLLVTSQRIFRAKAMDCWMSARMRLKMRMMNWFAWLALLLCP